MVTRLIVARPVRRTPTADERFLARRSRKQIVLVLDYPGSDYDYEDDDEDDKISMTATISTDT